VDVDRMKSTDPGSLAARNVVAARRGAMAQSRMLLQDTMGTGGVVRPCGAEAPEAPGFAVRWAGGR
jgi:hypothetical protein